MGNENIRQINWNGQERKLVQVNYFSEIPVAIKQHGLNGDVCEIKDVSVRINIRMGGLHKILIQCYKPRRVGIDSEVKQNFERDFFTTFRSLQISGANIHNGVIALGSNETVHMLVGPNLPNRLIQIGENNVADIKSDLGMKFRLKLFLNTVTQVIKSK